VQAGMTKRVETSDLNDMEISVKQVTNTLIRLSMVYNNEDSLLYLIIKDTRMCCVLLVDVAE
jgi:hypothetical protein